MRASIGILVLGVFGGLGFAASACGGAKVPLRERRLGVADHLDEASRHEADAAALEQLATESAASAVHLEPGCVDPVLAGQVTSGGERLIHWLPCWTQPDAVDARLHQASALRADASTHRRTAEALVQAERAACTGTARAHLDRSAFAHVGDIVAVTALREGDHIRGARVRFHRLPGLTPTWLRASIACQQARGAAVGWDPTHMAYDPTVLPGTRAVVREDGTTLVVDITATDDATALVAYHRAESLLYPEP